MEKRKNSMPVEGVGDRVVETEHESRAQLFKRHIERILSAHQPASEREEQEIKAHYSTMSPFERANILYGKLMAYGADKMAHTKHNAEGTNEGEMEVDPYLMSEMKVLFTDEKTQRTFLQTYAEARVDAKEHRHSDLGVKWNALGGEIKEKEVAYKKLEQDIYLHRIVGESNVSVAKSKMQRLAERLIALDSERRKIETLEELPHTVEYTDAVAQIQYEQLREYKRQLDRGFVWLPSRKKIHKETVSALLNHRWPVLIGEAGSGKSDQADAAAVELTGYMPTEIECESNTGEHQLIGDLASDLDGSYKTYGSLMQAFTGYEDSRQKRPAISTGRIARFDESGRLGDKGYAIIKKARQKKAGEDFYGHPMLSGASAIWTTNPVGPRYPGRRTLDPAMRREVAEIFVPYPELSEHNPELYDFMTASLLKGLKKNEYIAITEEELAPTYQKKELAERDQKTLEDGSKVIAVSELISEVSDARHGALWRFAGAIHALQESFVYGNAETEHYPDTVLRFKEDEHGTITIVNEGGEPLTLSTSTVALGELASWMSGFNERLQKQDAEFHTQTLTEWLNFKIKTYLKQADKADKAKLEALFRHFNFLNDSIPNIVRAKPLTPKAIGYLSPRVPRPVYVERPQALASEENPVQSAERIDVKEYTTKQVLLEDGTRILIAEREFTSGTGDTATIANQGRKIRVAGEDFSFAGVVDDPTSEYNGQPVGQFASGEELYHVFTEEALDQGMFSYEAEDLLRDITEELSRTMKEHWDAECVNNKKNNPKKVTAPSWL